MKLDQSHVGKRLRRPAWQPEDWLKIVAIEGGYVFGIDENDTGFVDEDKFTDWELVSEPKKPSEIISEIYASGRARARFKPEIDAVIQYLDEQAAESKK